MLVSAPFRRFVNRLHRTLTPGRSRSRLRRTPASALAPVAAMVNTIETLEDRQLLSASILVNSTVDATHYASSVTAAQLNPAVTSVTLRDAINACNNTAGDISITFDPTIFQAGQTTTINLTSGPLTITNSTGQVTIQGAAEVSTAAQQQIIISGTNLSGVFQVNAGANVEIDGCTITGGHAAIGAGINNQGTLTLRGDTIFGNDATVSASLNAGGGIATSGTLNVFDCTITENDASGATVNLGGGIYVASGGSATITDCTIARNTASVGGGLDAQVGGLVLLQGTILAANTVSLADSTPSDYGGISASILVTSNHNLVGDGTGTGLTTGVNGNIVGTTGSPVNANLSALANFGGGAQMIAVLPGSLAINAGAVFTDNNSAVISTDQRGIARVSGSIDIGAYQSANPTVVSINRVSPTVGVTSADTVTFAVTFDMPVANVSVDDFTVNAGTVSAVSMVNASSYNVTVNGLGSFTGTLTLGFAGGQNITDTAGLALTVTTPTGVNINTYIIDHSPPASVSLAGEYAISTSGGPSLALATIAQTGPATLTLNGSTSVSATINSSSLLTLAVGTATYADGKITFSADSAFAGQVWTKLDLPVNFTDSHGAATHVTQTGASVTFTDESGVSTPAVWINSTQLLLGGTTTVTVSKGKLLFSDGRVWFENVALNGSVSGTASGSVALTAVPSQIVVTDFTSSNGGMSVHMVQNGTTQVIFVDGLGEMALGDFFNASQASSPRWPGQVATVSNNGNTITWTDGTVWTRSAPSTQIIVSDYVTDYPAYAGVGVHVIQNGTSQLGWADGRGELSLGVFINATQATSDRYPGDVATFAAGNVVWQDGTIWTRSATPQVLITANVNGAASRLLAVNSTTLLGLDGSLQGSTGTRLNGKIYWSNGQVWTNLDFDQLNALFQMSVGVS
ncbi:MAG: hypothetical protein HY290_08235 [Planctomycetia bacterium]|nr:hypothetical protein [Planctomycetia bacterium]